jgi:hypothetical protein
MEYRNKRLVLRKGVKLDGVITKLVIQNCEGIDYYFFK